MSLASLLGGAEEEEVASLLDLLNEADEANGDDNEDGLLSLFADKIQTYLDSAGVTQPRRPATAASIWLSEFAL
jgi:hypothetical protein